MDILARVEQLEEKEQFRFSAISIFTYKFVKKKHVFRVKIKNTGLVNMGSEGPDIKMPLLRWWF